MRPASDEGPGPGRQPSPRVLLAEQLRVSAVLQRPTVAAWSPVAILLLALGGTEANVLSAVGLPEAWALLVLGLVWPLVLWRRDPPHGRAGFWAAPLHRGRHAALRIAAGWLVLAAVAAAYVVIQLALSVALPRAVLWWDIAAQYATRALAAVTTLYLLVTAVALRFERPVLLVLFAPWLLGALAVIQLDADGNPVAEAARGISLHLLEVFMPLPAGYGSWWPAALWLAAAVVICGLAAFAYQEPRRYH